MSVWQEIVWPQKEEDEWQAFVKRLESEDYEF